MPRKRRVWYPGAMYHISCRGNRKSDLFLDDKDREMYLNILKDAKDRYDFKYLGYCLMENHVHLHIETVADQIWNIMQIINSTYASYFNARYNKVGHVFQGRYASKIIKGYIHNLYVSKYVHLNPVEAKMVIKPLDYKWSSYSVYLGQRKSNLISTTKILSYFNYNRKEYQKYIEKDLGA